MTDQDQVTVPTGLRRTGVRSATAALLSATSEQLLSVAATVVLARLLTPEDFGLVAAATVIMGFVTALVHLGLGPAVLRRGDDPVALSTLFWFTVALAVVTIGILAALAGPLAHVVGEPRAKGFIAALGVVVGLRLLATVPKGVLQRDLRLGWVFGGDIVSALVYCAVQIGLAAAGVGAWAIIIGQLAAAGSALVIYAGAARWRPRRTFRRSIVRSEAAFSAGVTTNLGIAWVAKNADYWIIGRLAGATTLGVYYIAYVLPNIVRLRLTRASTEVMLPLLNQVVGDPERLRRGYLVSLRAHLVVGLPAMAGIAVLADHLIRLFFGPDWDAAVAPLRVLAIGAAIEFATQAGSNVFIAIAKPGRSVAIQIVRVAVLLALLAAVYVDGLVLTRVAWAVVVATAFAAVASIVLVGREIHVRPGAVVRVAAPVIGATAGMAAVLQAIRVGVLDDAGAVLTIGVLVPVGAAAYAGLLALIDREALGELVTDLKAAVGKRPATAVRSEQLDVAE